MKDDKILELARTRFKSSMDFESENRELALEDIRFCDLGEQWPDQIKREREADRRPCLTINKVPLFVRQVVNDIRQIRPSIKVRPVDSESDPETAEILNGMIRAIEQDSSAESAYDWAAEYAVKMGWGYWRIVTDYCDESSFDQDIRIERIPNPFSVYLDPSATRQDGSDAMFGFIVERMRRTEFEAKYPDAKSEWTEGDGDTQDWWYGNDYVRIAEYWEVVEEPVTLSIIQNDLTGEQVTTEESPPDIEGITVVAQRESVKRNVIQRLITGAEILETNDWLGKYIPIIRCYGRESNVEGKTVLKGMVRDLKDPARQYNYFRSASTERVALYAKAPWVGAEGAFKSRKWNDANTKNYPYLEYKPVPGETRPQRDPPPDISPGFANEIQVAAEEYKSVSGIYDAGIGARSNEVSGVAINSRRSESDVSNFDFVDNLARAMTYAGKILVDLIPKIYTGPRMVRILKPDGSDESVQINAPYFDQTAQKERRYMLEVGRYDVAVDIGPSYATQRQEASESMIEVLKAFPAAAQVMGDLVAKNFDWPEADEIAKRLKLLLPPEILQDENPAIKQMMQRKDMEIQQLQQQMQMLMTEAQKMSVELQNKQADTRIKEGDLEIKVRELMRKIQKDQMDHTEGMTSLELEAARDLSPQGLGYP